MNDPNYNKVEEFFKKYPGTQEHLVNAEFAIRNIDNAIQDHNHDGVLSPLIDQSVILDFATNGGKLYVRTPALNQTEDQSSMPDAQGTYSMDQVDQMMALKSDINHFHEWKNISGSVNESPTLIQGIVSVVNGQMTQANFSEKGHGHSWNEIQTGGKNLQDYIQDLVFSSSEDQGGQISIDRIIVIEEGLDRTLRGYLADEFLTKQGFEDRIQEIKEEILSEISDLQDEVSGFTDRISGIEDELKALTESIDEINGRLDSIEMEQEEEEEEDEEPTDGGD